MKNEITTLHNLLLDGCVLEEQIKGGYVNAKINRNICDF